MFRAVGMKLSTNLATAPNRWWKFPVASSFGLKDMNFQRMGRNRQKTLILNPAFIKLIKFELWAIFKIF